MAYNTTLLSIKADVRGAQLYAKALQAAEGQLKQFGTEAETINKMVGSKFATTFDKNGNQILTFAGQFQTSMGRMISSSAQLTNQGVKPLKAALKEGADGLGDFEKAMRRVLIVVPVWMATRTIIQGVTSAIRDGVSSWLELEAAMGRVATVTKAVGSSQAEFAEIQKQIREFTAQSSASIKDVANVAYQLGSAGLSTSEIMGGFKDIMKLSVGTMSDAESTAKTVTVAYKLFGDQLSSTLTTQEKFAKITNLIAQVFTREQVEVGEVSDALSYVAASASQANVRFEDLVSTIGFLNTGGLRGAKAGRNLAQGFAQAANKLSELELLTGRAFDKSEPLDFMKLMEALNARFGEGKLALEEQAALTKVFGVEGGRSIQGILARWTEWTDAIKAGREVSDGFADNLKQNLENNVPKQLDILKNKWRTVVGNMMEEWKPFITETLKGWQIIVDEIDRAQKKRASFANGQDSVTKRFETLRATQDSNPQLFRGFNEEEKTQADIFRGVGSGAVEGAGRLPDSFPKEPEKKSDNSPIIASENGQLATQEKTVKEILYTEEAIKDKRAELASTGMDSLEVEKEILRLLKEQQQGAEEIVQLKQQQDRVDKEQVKRNKELSDLRLNLLAAEGSTGLQVANERLRILTEEMKLNKENIEVVKALYDIQLEKAKQVNTRVQEIRGAFKSAFSEGLDSGSLSGMFDTLKSGIRKSFIDAAAEGLTNQVMGLTGIDKMLGQNAAALEMQNAIITGSTQGAQMYSTAISSASQAGAQSLSSGLSSAATGGGATGKAVGGIGGLSGIFGTVSKLAGIGLLASSLFQGSKSQSGNQYDKAPGASSTATADTRSTVKAKVTNIVISPVFNYEAASIDDKKTISETVKKISELVRNNVVDFLNNENIALGNE